MESISKNALAVTVGRPGDSSQPKIIKQQSSIFRKQSLPKNKFEKVDEAIVLEPEHRISVAQVPVSRVQRIPST